MLARMGEITPRTQKVISSLTGSWRAGGTRRSLIYVSRGNIDMSHGPVYQGEQGAAAECGLWFARARHRTVRGGAASVAQVRFVTPPSLSIPRPSRQPRAAGGSRGSLDSHHLETSTAHRAGVALLCRPQRVNARRDRHTWAGSVSERASQTWLSDGQDVAAYKSISTIRLIVYLGRNSPRCMNSWYPRSSVWSVPR